MKKFIFFSVAIFAFATSLFAQNQILTVGNNDIAMNNTVLLLSNDNQTIIRFDVNRLDLVEVATNYGKASIPLSDKAPLMLQKGFPELFFLTSSFIIPDRGNSELEISYGSYIDYANIEIAPSKGNLTRNIDPKTVPFVKGDIYQKDGFFPGTLASLREPFIMRDIRGQSVDVYPIQYNPVTKTLRVYSEITVTINNTRTTGKNEFTTQKRHATIDPEFSAMYDRMFINSSVLQHRGHPTGEAGEILVICHTPWMDEMKPYVDWKRTMGRKTTLVSTATTGTTATEIKTYLTNYYNNPENNLAFVLLVGDAAQIPSIMFTGGSPSPAPADVLFGDLTGDYYLEFLVGRMSSESPAHIQTQVQRTIAYERDLTTADTWLSAGIGVARNEGGGSNGHDGYEADYQHMNNIRTRMMNYGYDPVWQEYDGTCPEIPNTTAALINQRVNAGVGVLNYCNHGSQTGWSVAGYSITNVNQLQNANKLPYLFLVACNNGEFHTGLCFSEAWMRHTYNNQPAGAIAVLGASIVTGWNPPMTGQDEFVDLFMNITHTANGGQTYGLPGKNIRTMGGAMLNGSQKTYLIHGSSGLNDYRSWTLFGDPSMNFRTKTPQAMTVTYLPVIFIGNTSLSVNCDSEGAVAALSYIDNNEVIIVGTAAVSDGVAEINFDIPVNVPMDLNLCVTGHNRVTYIGEVSVIPPTGPYVVHQGYSVVGSDKLTYLSTNQEIEVTLKNVGIAPTSGTLIANISCTDPQLSIVTGSTQLTSTIAPGSTTTVKFKITVANDIIDGKSFPLNLAITGGAELWESTLILKAFAPEFKLSKVLIEGAEDGSLPQGSLATITLVVDNKGGADAFNVQGKLVIDDQYILIPCEDGKSRAPQNLPAGESMNLDFFVITSLEMPSGYEVDMKLELTANYGRSYTETFKVANTGSGNFCIPELSTGCTAGDRFTSVILVRNSDQVELINHAPLCGTPNGYSDYTNIKVPVNAGEQFTLKVMVGYSSQNMKAWVDANGNNIFDTSELLCQGSCPNSGQEYTFNITIPNDFIPGEQRFRLRCTYSTAPADACSAASWGQTLDYTFIFPNLYPKVQNVEAALDGADIKITWQAPIEGTPIGYNIYRNDNNLNGSTPLTVLNFTETNVENGVYAYNVRAVYEGNKESAAVMSNVICFFPTLCEKPISLSGDSIGNNAKIFWEKPENIDGVLLGYYIYRGIDQLNETPYNNTEYLDENLEDGTYIYKISAVYEHCDESELTEGVTVVINTVGIKENQTSSINLYPNPTSGEITITNYESRITNIEIYDIYGRIVFSNHLIASPTSHLVNVSHLQSGIYFVKIYSENNAPVTKRLVLTK
ncbi:MAG: C25 family cysteine peptidase [Bacteroidales bacterium]|jgi:hypothetical protein|nr:C25 family cysteine peptidase [Bacteroidales bacterium]